MYVPESILKAGLCLNYVLGGISSKHTISLLLTVDCETKVISLLSSFLSELDHLEGRCSPVMATVSLFIALKENSTTDHIKQLLTGKSLSLQPGSFHIVPLG